LDFIKIKPPTIKSPQSGLFVTTPPHRVMESGYEAGI